MTLSVDSRDATTVQVGQHKLTLRYAQMAHGADILALHHQVFGSKLDQNWLAWKYGKSDQLGRWPGVGVWNGPELIAYCGGVPRQLWRLGSPVSGLQIGDVMVAPKWRGILTRRGPFFYASQHLYDTYIGMTKEFQLGYGFPNFRAMRLPVALGLAWDGGEIHSLAWSLTSTPTVGRPVNVHWLWAEVYPDAPSFDALIDDAWARMRGKATGMTVGQRDIGYVRWRYLDRPAEPGVIRRCRFFLLRHRWSRRIGGVAVLDLSNPCAKWLDWIGDPLLMPIAAQGCKWQVAQAGIPEMCAWASNLVTKSLQGCGITSDTITARLGVPCNSTVKKQDLASMQWWLMGGDTDFL